MDKKFHYKLDDIESLQDGSDLHTFWLREERGGQVLALQGEIVEELELSNVRKLVGTIAIGGTFSVNIVTGHDFGRFTHRVRQGEDFIDVDHQPFDTASRLRGMAYFDHRTEA